MRLKPLEIVSLLNASYWFIPLVVTLGGVALAVMLLSLDDRLALQPDGPLALLRPSSAEGARALLSAVIGAMITAVSVAFSMTIVALTVAAQHFGPRVLNSFLRHTSAQLVLGAFLATFAYAVLVLGAIRGTGADANLPGLAVSGAGVLVVVSVGALIYYVHHVSTSLQIGELTADIARDFEHTLQRVDVTDAPTRVDTVEIPDAPPDAAPITAEETGYVQRVDYDAVVRAAGARDAVVWIRREPGAFIVAGTPFALVHPPRACDEMLVAAVRHACIVGTDRTLWQDPEFALKQLVEVALRGLSPGVNEPFTAMTCIDQLTRALARVATTPAPCAWWADAAGLPRVYSNPQPFSVLLRAAFDPIRIFAGPNPAIYTRLLDSIGELALLAMHETHRRDLRHQADVIRRAAEGALSDPDDRAYVATRYERAIDQFRHGPSASRR